MTLAKMNILEKPAIQKKKSDKKGLRKQNQSTISNSYNYVLIFREE